MNKDDLQIDKWYTFKYKTYYGQILDTTGKYKGISIEYNVLWHMFDIKCLGVVPFDHGAITQVDEVGYIV